MASSVKYILFLFVFLSLIGGELIIANNKGIELLEGTAGKDTVSENQGITGMITGNVSSQAASPNTFVFGVIFAGIIITVLLLWFIKDKKLSFLEARSHAYAALILRIILGVFFIMAGLAVEPSISGYMIGILEIAAGVLFLVGIFVRPVAYLSFFYLVTTLFTFPPDYAVTFLLMAIALALFLLGGKEYSFDGQRERGRK